MCVCVCVCVCGGHQEGSSVSLMQCERILEGISLFNSEFLEAVMRVSGSAAQLAEGCVCYVTSSTPVCLGPANLFSFLSRSARLYRHGDKPPGL